MMIPAGTQPPDPLHPVRQGRNGSHYHDERRDTAEAKREKVWLGEEPRVHGAENDRPRI